MVPGLGLRGETSGGLGAWELLVQNDSESAKEHLQTQHPAQSSSLNPKP